MAANDVFVNYFNFNLFGYNMHQSLLKSIGTEVKKGNCQGTRVSYKIYLKPGLEPEPELEPKEIFSAPQHWNELVNHKTNLN
jgi:hypothetical protein